MENRTHYEAYRNSCNEVGIRAIDQTGLIINQVEGLGDFQKAENLATLYNANHLMPEHFSEVTEQLLGMLV